MKSMPTHITDLSADPVQLIAQGDGTVIPDDSECPCQYAPGSWCDTHNGNNPICDCDRVPRAWCSVCEGCADCGQCNHTTTEEPTESVITPERKTR